MPKYHPRFWDDLDDNERQSFRESEAQEYALALLAELTKQVKQSQHDALSLCINDLEIVNEDDYEEHCRQLWNDNEQAEADHRNTVYRFTL